MDGRARVRPEAKQGLVDGKVLTPSVTDALRHPLLLAFVSSANKCLRELEAEKAPYSRLRAELPC